MEQWSSRFGFVFAAIGAAVGLGNIWRFPAVVGQNGGGAYLLPYLVAAFAFALPLLIFEISIGRALQADVVTAFREVGERFEIVGWIVGGSVLAVLSYYLVITGWVLAFLAFAVAGRPASFAAFTDGYLPVVSFLASTLLVGGSSRWASRRGSSARPRCWSPGRSSSSWDWPSTSRPSQGSTTGSPSS